MVLLLWKPLLLLLAVALQKTALATERARELCSFDPVESDVPEKFYSDGTEMMRAAKCGDLERVKKLFEEKPDEINRQNSYGKTSLMFAVKYGAVKVGAYLIQKTELDVQDFHGMTALMISVWFSRRNSLSITPSWIYNLSGVGPPCSLLQSLEMLKQPNSWSATRPAWTYRTRTARLR